MTTKDANTKSDMAGPVIGIIGGSGLYQIDGLADVEWRRIDSPFGRTSDEFCFGSVDGQPVVFVARHGRGHVLPPSEIDFRANIDALKRCGVTDIVSLSAVGSLREDFRPGDFVVIDQFIDRTFARQKSFFGKGCVAHVSMARPVCGRIGDTLVAAGPSAGMALKRGGTYLVMEGPQFSSLAESELYRAWKCDVIGMTNMPEAKLAREAEICYATVAMVTDYDCWHPGHDAVTVDMIVGVLLANAEKAKALISRVVPLLATHSGPCRQGCQRALDQALITAPEQRDPEMLARLDAVAGRVLGRPEPAEAG
jgi:5'-methylthioadenosine phosphorylase